MEGELTATRAAELLGDSPGNMSWHLQTLAKYGFVEEVEGRKGRSRPWRAVADHLDFKTAVPDPELSAAGDALESVYVDRFLRRLREWWTVRRSYSLEWRRAAFTSHTIIHLTPAELEQLSEELSEVFARYYELHRDPAQRNEDAVAVSLAAFGHPLPPGGG